MTNISIICVLCLIAFSAVVSGRTLKSADKNTDKKFLIDGGIDLGLGYVGAGIGNRGKDQKKSLDQEDAKNKKFLIDGGIDLGLGYFGGGIGFRGKDQKKSLDQEDAKNKIYPW